MGDNRTSTLETVYMFVRGVGWVPATHRTAEQTRNLMWMELEPGDAVYVYDKGKIRIGKVHKRDKPEPLQPEDTGSWLYILPETRGPFEISGFGKMKHYPKYDSAWTALEGVSFPNGEEYQ